MTITRTELAFMLDSTLFAMTAQAPQGLGIPIEKHEMYPMWEKLTQDVVSWEGKQEYIIADKGELADNLLAIVNGFDLDEDIPGTVFKRIYEQLWNLGYLLCWKDTQTKYMLSKADPELWKGPMPGEEQAE